MSEFLFLYRSELTTERPSPEQMQQVMQQWGTWLKSLAERGHLKDMGQPLEDGGRVVRTGKSITDGPYAETKDVIGGYSIILAENIDEAVALTEGCPSFDRGGLIEVRPIYAM